LREATRARKVAEGREESLRLDLTASEGRLVEVEGKVRSFQRTATELSDKGRKYDSVLTRAQVAEKKYDELRRMAEEQAMALNNAADNEKKVLTKSLDNEHQLQLLAMDKSFLQKELELSTQRAERSEADYQRSEEVSERNTASEPCVTEKKSAKIRAKLLFMATSTTELTLFYSTILARSLHLLLILKRASPRLASLRSAQALRNALAKRDELVMQLTEVRESRKNDYESKMVTEVQRVREDSAREISDIRSNSNELWERENRLLRDARQDAVKQTEKVERDLVELRNAHEALVLRHAKVNAEQGSDVVELKNEQKRLNFENSKLGAVIEALNKDLNEAGIQVSECWGLSERSEPCGRRDTL